jgi:predicted Zn finger-like uncharacterized protein
LRSAQCPLIKDESDRLGIAAIMKLVCPSCDSGFLVDATAIKPTGRKVRCGRCGNSWLAMPVETIPDELADLREDQSEDSWAQAGPEELGPEELGPEEARADGTPPPGDAALPRPIVTTSGPLPPEAPPGHWRSSRRRPDRERGRSASFVGWALFALCAAALVVGLVVGRQQLMAWAPETVPLYVLLGLADERPIPPAPLVQLRLRDVTSGRRQVNGTPELVIEGEIFNPTDRSQDVPELVATLMDPTGIELKRWVFAAETDVLPPGGHAPFHTSTQDPPGQGNLNLNFVPHRR